VIPTLLIAGLVLGRWWKSTIVLATMTWCLILLAAGTIDVRQLGGTALLACLNVSAGVLVHQVIRTVVNIARTPGTHA